MQEICPNKIIKKREKKKGFDFVINNLEHSLNENIQFNFGSIDDKKFPKSIYINSTFWFELNKEKIIENFETDNSFNRYFRKSINDIFKNSIFPEILNNNIWNNKEDSIFYYDLPNNIFYSDKRCFCSLELTLYTNNSKGNLNDFDYSPNNILYESIIQIIKKISSSDFFNDKENYSIHKRKK